MRFLRQLKTQTYSEILSEHSYVELRLTAAASVVRVLVLALYGEVLESLASHGLRIPFTANT